MSSGVQLRRATLEDVDVFMADVTAGFDSYREFEPPGWCAPDMTGERGHLLEILGDRRTWGMVALEADAPAGHVAFVPGRERAAGGGGGGWRARPRIAGLAHLWQLFVLPAWWGRGVADRLHAAAVQEMRRQGYTHGRLYTPSRHARARRFYERRGWTAVLDAWSAELNLTLTEYRLELGRPG